MTKFLAGLLISTVAADGLAQCLPIALDGVADVGTLESGSTLSVSAVLTSGCADSTVDQASLICRYADGRIAAPVSMRLAVVRGAAQATGQLKIETAATQALACRVDFVQCGRTNETCLQSLVVSGAAEATPVTFEEQIREVRSRPLEAGGWVALGNRLLKAGQDERGRSCQIVARLLEAERGSAGAGDDSDPTPCLELVGIQDTKLLNTLVRRAEARAQPDISLALVRYRANVAPTSLEFCSQRVRHEPLAAAAWAGLGRVLSSTPGATDAASGCHSLARLLTSDGPSSPECGDPLTGVVAALVSAGITDDEKIGAIAEIARDKGHRRTARELYKLALSIDATDSVWPKRIASIELDLRRELESATLRVTTEKRDAAAWAELGDLHAEAGEQALASQCFTVARLLSPQAPSRPSKVAVSMTNPVGVINGLGIVDDDWVGELAVQATALSEPIVARRLNEFAHQLAPQDDRWRRRLGIETLAAQEARERAERTPPVRLPDPREPSGRSSGRAAVNTLGKVLWVGGLIGALVGGSVIGDADTKLQEGSISEREADRRTKLGEQIAIYSGIGFGAGAILDVAGGKDFVQRHSTLRALSHVSIHSDESAMQATIAFRF